MNSLKTPGERHFGCNGKYRTIPLPISPSSPPIPLRRHESSVSATDRTRPVKQKPQSWGVLQKEPADQFYSIIPVLDSPVKRFSHSASIPPAKSARRNDWRILAFHPLRKTSPPWMRPVYPSTSGQIAASSPSRRSVRHLALPPALMNSPNSV